jgi:hypothetical protein
MLLKRWISSIEHTLQICSTQKERFPNVGFTDISSALYHDLVSIGQNDQHGNQSFFIPLQSPQLFVQIDEQNCS